MIKRVAGLRGGVGGMGLEGKAMVGRGNVVGVVGEDGCGTGRWWVFSTAALRDGVVATGAASSSAPVVVRGA